METFVKGDVVVLLFPFSDLSSSKKRPAFVVSVLEGDDLILCQITSSRSDKYSVAIKNADFKQGRLNVESCIRPNRLFTADKSILQYKVGSLSQNKIKEVIKKIEEIINS